MVPSIIKIRKSARGEGKRSRTGIRCFLLRIILLVQAAVFLLLWKSGVFSSSKDTNLQAMHYRTYSMLETGEKVERSLRNMDDLGIRYLVEENKTPDIDDKGLYLRDNYQGLIGPAKAVASTNERDGAEAPEYASSAVEAPELFVSKSQRQKVLVEKGEEEGEVEDPEREKVAMTTIGEKSIDYDPEVFRQKLLNKKHWLFYIRIQKTGSETMWKALLQVRKEEAKRRIGLGEPKFLSANLGAISTFDLKA